MESLAYYESEDEQEIENSSKTRDVSPKPMNKQRVEILSPPSSSHAVAASSASSTRKEQISYNNIQMDLSEDSDDVSSSSGKNRPHYRKSENVEARRKQETSSHRRHSVDEKKSKIREQQTSRDRDYDKRDYYKVNEREKLSKSKYRDDRDAPVRYRHDNKSRVDKDGFYRDRDKDRGEKNRDRDRFRERNERHRDRGDYGRDRQRDANRSDRNQPYDKYKERERDLGIESKGRERERSLVTREFNTRRSDSPDRDNKERKSSVEIRLPIQPPPPPKAPSLIQESSNSLVVTVLPLDKTNNINLNFIERRKEKVQQIEKMGIDIKSTTIKPGVELPSYYNPGVINPTKYADQVQKRKLLWSHKKNEQEQAAAKWETAKFSQDQDGKVASKFMRLMGIKDAPPKPTGESSKTQDLTKKQEELFSTMEQQYEVARQVTHTMRGVGLGFGSQPRQF